jgi:hypothetical protein
VRSDKYTPAVRDLTPKKFWEAVERHGMKPAPFGYVEIDGGKLSVNRMNGGWTYRMQLAYLLREQAKYESQIGGQE